MDTDRETELKRLIDEQEKDRRTRTIKSQIIEPPLLIRARKKAAKDLKHQIRTAKNKRQVRYALIRFMDDIGVPRAGISKVLDMSLRTIQRVIYGSVNTPSSGNKKNVAP